MSRPPLIHPDNESADRRLWSWRRPPLRKTRPISGWWRDALGFVLTVFFLVSFWFVVAVVIP